MTADLWPRRWPALIEQVSRRWGPPAGSHLETGRPGDVARIEQASARLGPGDWADALDRALRAEQAPNWPASYIARIVEQHADHVEAEAAIPTSQPQPPQPWQVDRWHHAEQARAAIMRQVGLEPGPPKPPPEAAPPPPPPDPQVAERREAARVRLRTARQIADAGGVEQAVEICREVIADYGARGPGMSATMLLAEIDRGSLIRATRS